ncbi:hypothetical protein GNT69_11665 [Bacillus sp. B15-48]|nr:hypothetical protein [Bacillus sp. B15-48]
MTITVITGAYTGHPGYGQAHYIYPQGHQPFIVPHTWQALHPTHTHYTIHGSPASYLPIHYTPREQYVGGCPLNAGIKWP